ncbi:MAG: fasciclin domain-containing protein, partial [Anaerolineae bacterium]|nr:fasciclin domain-containing protein [Anaerolineae bacterium]
MYKKVAKTIYILLTLGLLASMTTLAFAAPTSQDEAQDIDDTAVADGRFTTLATALDAAGLIDTLKGEGPFTVFAPTDEAFAALPEGTLDSLLADPEALTQVLLYHVVAGEVPAADVVSLTSADTVEGQPVSISVDGEAVMVGGANVIQTDVMASNGIIHVIDAVLLPPSDDSAMMDEETMMEETGPDVVDVAVADGRFTTLATALEAAGLIDTLKGEGPFTVFAPTDEAFAALPEGTLDSLLADIPALTNVLLYHVVAGEVPAATVVTLPSADTVLGQPVSITVEGESVKVNEANVIQTDVMASNGIIHVIDAVLIPAEDGAMMAAEEGATMAENAVATSCSEDYVIQADDSLSKIADKFFGSPTLYDGIVAATNAAAAADSRYATIDNPGLIFSGQTLCIPATADATVAPVAEAAPGEETMMADEEMMAAPAVPEGKSLLSFENLSSVDLVLDLSGPMFDTAVVPPAGTQDFILEPGSYGYIGHQPGGDYSVAPGDFTMVAGQALELVCYDGGSCTVQRPQVMVDDSATMTDDESAMMEEEAAPASLDIVDTAIADGRFTTLATALEAAGLVDTLKGEGPFTVFAPTDEA